MKLNSDLVEKESTPESTLPRPKATRRIKLGKYGLAENVIGKHASIEWKGRKLLGEIRDAQYNATRGYIELTILHFNGDDWPLRPVASAVSIIDPLPVSQSAI